MSGAVKATLSAALLEFQARSQDALSLFRAMPTQVGFINSNASHRLVRGGNRSGKSTICAVEIASAAMGRPVIGPDGKALKFKYPQDRPLMIWVIGLGQSHIGDTLHRLLFKPGAFKVIKDLSTGVMRAWNPDDPADLAREAEKQDAPPLIPERYATEDTFAWDNKKAKVFTHWTNPSNGTVIRAFTSLGDVKQGDPVDLIWIDEDIQNPDDINEFTTRLSDRKGRLIWSSWPRIANPALLRMSTRATEQQGREKPDCQEWCLKFTGNPHIDADEKRKRLDEWGPEVARARDQGEFVLDTVLVYPEFNEELHCTPPRAGHEWDEIDKILAANNYVPPRDWTRRLFLDPGHSTTAMLFTATTPPSLGSYVVFYDGLYIHNCTAEEAAKRAYEKIAGYKFYSFTIDYRFGRQHHPGNALPGGEPRSNREIYAAAFAKYGLQSQVTGSSFNWSSDDVTAGLTAFRSWLIPQSNGRPKVRIVKHKLIEFIKEMQLYRKQVTKDVSEDKPANGQHDHFMDTARYAAMERCDFVAVIDDGLGGRDPGDSYRDFHQNFNRGRQQSSSVTCTFGPGVAA